MRLSELSRASLVKFIPRRRPADPSGLWEDQIISRNFVCAFGLELPAVPAHRLFAIAAVLRNRPSAEDTALELGLLN
jgi:hypothetical protein